MKSLAISMLFIVGCAAATPGANGLNGSEGVQGATGSVGAAGANGPTGAQGASCTVSQNQLGALIQCPDGSSALILHGLNGATGPTGETHNHKKGHR